MQYLGIEIEVENTGRLSRELFSPYWRSTTDGSIRDGVEYVSRKLSRSELNASISDIKPFITSSYHSERTSIHVHLDCEGDLSRANEFKLKYLRIERHLIAWIAKRTGYDRSNNRYAMPLHMLYSIFSDSKYVAVSTNRLGDLGTVEVRSMGGTINTRLIERWATFLMDVQKEPFETFLNKPKLKLFMQSNKIPIYKKRDLHCKTDFDRVYATVNLNSIKILEV